MKNRMKILQTLIKNSKIKMAQEIAAPQNDSTEYADKIFDEILQNLKITGLD